MAMPLAGRDFPDLRREAAADVIPLFHGDDAHAAFFRDPSGTDVEHRLGRTQDGEAEVVEPVAGHDVDGLAHQALALPWQAQPEPSVVVLRFQERNAAYELAGGALEPQGPMPFVT